MAAGDERAEDPARLRGSVLATRAAGANPRRVARTLEMLALFLGVPVCLSGVMEAWMLFPAVWLLGAVSLVLLLRDRGFRRHRLWGWKLIGRARGRAAGRAALARFALAAPVLAGTLAIVHPERVLWLPTERPERWALIMLLYPVLSVYPQELGFRAMFFRRYRVVLGRGAALEWGSAAAFAAGHLVLHNWVAVVMSLAGGWMFARTYRRSRSLALACLEHAAYGCLLFTIGWGAYFYSGTGGLQFGSFGW